MKPVMRNILAVIGGVLLGSLVNMGLLLLGGQIISPPQGVDVMDPESLQGNMHLFQPRHFLFPFLAHALGTMVGSFTAAWLSATDKWYFALGVGSFFLLGGVINALSLPAPAWFIALDLVAAYLPMAWLGGRLATGVPWVKAHLPD